MGSQVTKAVWRIIREPIVSGAIFGLGIWGIGLWTQGGRFPQFQHKLALLLPCFVVGLTWRLVIGYAIDEWFS